MEKRWSLGSGTGRRAGRGLSARDQASCKLDQTANCSFPPVPYNLVIFHCGRLERIINYCLPLAISALNQVRKAKKGKEKKKAAGQKTIIEKMETVAESCGQNTHSRIQHISLPALPPGMESLPVS